MTSLEFNDEVRLAVDEALHGVLGEKVLKALYDHLIQHYDITANEIPYRLDTLFTILESTFGVKGALTLSRVIAKRVYTKMGLRFIELPNYDFRNT